MDYYGFAPYVPVARKLAMARKAAEKQAKKEGRELAPVKSSGRKLVTKFWGQAWCENLDHYSDIANRLPRGRRYLGNGSVVDLQIAAGEVRAIVAGSETYRVQIQIKTVPAKVWKALQADCARSIHSLLDLLQGRFDEGVMRRLAQREGGLFPQRKEIDMECSCPDYADVCKHIAAVMYGVGVRLDASPELLFTLRDVDHTQLIQQAVAAENLEQSLAGQSHSLAGSDLGAMFGIELEEASASPAIPAPRSRAPRTKKPAAASPPRLKTKAKPPAKTAAGPKKRAVKPKAT